MGYKGSSVMVGTISEILARLLTFAIVAASLIGVGTAPAVAADENSCPLDTGIVINGSREAWGIGFVRSDLDLDAATRGPAPVSIPAGQYDITLASYDRHTAGDQDQPNEAWFIEARNGDTLVFASNAISDLPQNQRTLTETVNVNVALPDITSITAKHAAYPDGSNPNSVSPICVSFVVSSVLVETPVGLVDPTTSIWHLRDGNGLQTQFYYGNPGDAPFMGDWDCDGTATPGLYRQSDGFAYLRNSNTQGNADLRFFFGNPGDVPLAGDFNNDGCDTLSIYRPSQQRFYIINELGSDDTGLGVAEYSFLFGNPGDKPVVGDWDGDGIDEIGLHRESTGFFYFRNTLDTGNASDQFFFGNPGDRFIAGDWGVVDGIDTPAVFRPANTTFYFRHTNTQGNADAQIVWGRSWWLPVAGEFSLN